MTRAAIRFRIDFENDRNLGPGKIELLENIAETGSLSAAARAMGMSYRKAWLLLESLNETFIHPATINSVGGVRGGGAHVTEFGHLILERYRQLDERIRGCSAECLRDVIPHLSPGSGAARKLKRTPSAPRRR